MRYRMINPDSGEPEDIECSVADMEVMKQSGWIMVFTPNPNSIISGRDHSGQSGGHGTDQGWKDVLRRIKSNNPKSNIDI